VGDQLVDKVLVTFKFGFVGVLVETEQPPGGTLLVGTGVPRRSVYGRFVIAKPLWGGPSGDAGPYKI
ncbi:MAG: hypothetical protein IJW99_03500, partial [Clostridia bacterium]|nr:hypothetical protein [Clostridia bacterium]